MTLLLQALAEEAPQAGRPVAGLYWIDHVGLALVLVFSVLGAVRGLWWQVFRLIGLAGAILIARTLSPVWGPRFEQVSGLPPLIAQGVVWLGLFVVGLLVASLLGMVGKRSLEAMQLGPLDRFGGMLAGALTGLLLHATLLVALALLGPQPWTAHTLEGTYSQGVARSVSTRLPVLVDAGAADEIRAWLDEVEGERRRGFGREVEAKEPAAAPNPGIGG